MTTISSASSYAYNKIIHGKFQEGEAFLHTQDIYKYQILYTNVIKDLNTYLQYYSTGNYTTLTDTFTSQVVNKLSLESGRNYNTDKINQLVDFSYNNMTFENFRKNTFLVFDGLNKSIDLTGENKNLINKNIILKADSDILRDPILLSSWIESRNINVMPFMASETFNAEIKLKLWYSEYLILHGAPGNGVFSSELLAAIVSRLISENRITEEEFINS